MHGHITVAPKIYYFQVYNYYAFCQALNNNIYTQNSCIGRLQSENALVYFLFQHKN